MRLKMLLKNINVLNILLASVIALVVCLDVVYYLDTGTGTALPRVSPIAAAEAEQQVAYQSPPMSDFVIVSEENLFHPERKTPLGKAGESARPDIVLYGTLILGDTAIAYIEDRNSPYSTPGRGKRQKAIKKGDAVSGFVLKEIGRDMIVLERGEDKMTVLLKDRKDRHARSSAMPAHLPQSPSRPPTQLRPQNIDQPPVRPAVPVIVPPPRR